MSVVVVGIDGSDESMNALKFAATEAKFRHVPLRLVHAFTIPIDGTWTGGAVVSPAPFEQVAHHLVDGALAAAGNDLAGIDVERIVEPGGAALAMLDHASKDDLIVVGSRGRGGFKGLLLGSVSQQVVLHARCPVVVVRGGDD
jgi:nucleotide-binding universal stress UspA family protein